MIIDFKDLLHRYYREHEFDIPMVVDVVEEGAMEINRAVEKMLITNSAVKSCIDAGLDPTQFRAVNLQEYSSGGILFYTAADDEWEYRLAGAMSNTLFEGSYQEGWIKPVETDPHPTVDVMRKKPGANHWQIWNDDIWLDNGPPVGFLEQMSAALQRQDDPRTLDTQE